MRTAVGKPGDREIGSAGSGERVTAIERRSCLMHTGHCTQRRPAESVRRLHARGLSLTADDGKEFSCRAEVPKPLQCEFLFAGPNQSCGAVSTKMPMASFGSLSAEAWTART